MYRYCVQNCFICRPSDSTVSEDAGIEPRTGATSAVAVRRSNRSARSHPSMFSPRLMGDRLPRRMTDLQAMTGGRGRSTAAATEDNKPGEQVSLLEAAVSRLTAAETPTPDGAAASSSSTSSRLSMLILPRVERLEDTVRSVKKDLGMGENRLCGIYCNPKTYCKQCCGFMSQTYGSGCGSGSCYFHHWPWDANKKLIYFKKFSAYYFLKVHLHRFQR